MENVSILFTNQENDNSLKFNHGRCFALIQIVVMASLDAPAAEIKVGKMVCVARKIKWEN